MPKQVDKFTNERQDILNKMFLILGVNENNNTFLLHELDQNIEKQNKILELEPEIKKYFICGSWSCFRNEDAIKNKSLSIIKSVVKDMGLKIMINTKVYKEGDTSIKRKVYHIVKSI
jgi:hypothetical protein